MEVFGKKINSIQTKHDHPLLIQDIGMGHQPGPIWCVRALSLFIDMHGLSSQMYPHTAHTQIGCDEAIIVTSSVLLTR